MSEKIIKSRIVNKHDIEAHWLLATGFTPMKGELIIYDVDENYSYERFKIGDGETNVNSLPFVDDALRTKLTGQIEGLTNDIANHNSAEDAHSNMGWLTSEDEEASTPTPLDADTLGGHDASYFINKIEEIKDIAGPSDVVLYTPQELTEGQKARARENIGAATVDAIINVIDPKYSENLLDGAEWTCGYVNAYGGNLISTVSELQAYADAGMTNILPIKAGATYVLTYKPIRMTDAGPWWAIQTFDENGVFIERIQFGTTEYEYVDGVPKYTTMYTPADEVAQFRISGRSFAWYNDRTKTKEEMNSIIADIGPDVFTMYEKYTSVKLLPDVTDDDDGKTLCVRNGTWGVSDPTCKPDLNLSVNSANTITNMAVTKALRMLSITDNVKAVAHRGYSAEAPENTLPAYILARRKGFRYAECDVSFTSDGVAVLLHDGTIDRTSDGTGNISEMTYDAVSTLDFGSWFSEDFTGTKMPSFKEFIILCREIGLHPYIELKPSGSTQERINGLVDTVLRVGMRDKVTWISFYSNLLECVKNADDKARLGFIVNAFDDNTIATCESLKTDKNEVFLDAPSAAAETVSACIAAKIPLELWTINSEQTILNMNKYVTGVTSDMLHAGQILFDRAMSI